MIELTALPIDFMRMLAIRRRTKRLKPAQVQVAAAIELTRLGDVLSAVPAIRGLRRHFPHAMIHLVVDTAHAALLDAMQLGVHVLGVKNPTSAGSLLSTARYLRGLRPDIALSLSPSKRNAFLALSSASRMQAGYLSHVDTMTPHLEVTPVEGYGFVPAASINYGREPIHDRSAKVLTVMGGQHHLEGETDPVRLRNEDALHKDLLSRRVIPRSDYAVIHPFAGWVYRQWDMRQFAQLGRELILEHGIEIVFLSEAKDQDALQRLREEFRDEPRARFVSFLDLIQMGVLIQNASIFIGNDSGPLHLAALLGVRVVGLFGPAPPELTGPNSTQGEYLYKPIECSPCTQRVCERPRESCMTLIGQAEVFEAAGRMLRHSRGPVAANG